MLFRGRAFRGAGCRTSAWVGGCLIALASFAAHCNGQDAAGNWADAKQSRSDAAATQKRPNLLVVVTDDDASRPLQTAANNATSLRLRAENSVASDSSVGWTAAGSRPSELTLTAPPNGQDAPAANSQPASDTEIWKAQSGVDFETLIALTQTAAAPVNEDSMAPRPLAAPDAHHIVVRLPSPRLALQPANSGAGRRAAGETADEPIPPMSSSNNPFEDPPADDAPADDAEASASNTDSGAVHETFPPAPANAAPGAAGKDTIAGAERLGEEPVDNRLQFLRSEAVLLEPGQWQWDVGLVYAFQHDDIPIVIVDNGGNVTNVVEGNVRQRELFVPLAARYGLNRRTQLFVSVPVGWSNTELSFDTFDEFDNDGGIGDITFGPTFLLSSNECRDVMFTFAATAPTGGNPFDDDLSFPGASLGDGFWALSGEFLCTHTYDPVVVFSSIGTRHYFENEFHGAKIQPGSEWVVSMGVAFAASPKVTLSARFSAVYTEETEVNGDRLEGTIQEPMSVRLAATIAQCKRWFEPFVEFGTSDDQNTSVFGVIYTY